MATLSFSFAGASINANGLTEKVKKFELLFEQPVLNQNVMQSIFSIEYFHSINAYAENLNEAFYMAANEANIVIDKLFLQITGNLNSKVSDSVNAGYNTIEVSILVHSDATEGALSELLETATNLIPFEESTQWKGKIHFSLNSIIHLN